MSDLQDRAAGVLLGLAAGDRVGGPIRMALRLAESLVDRGGFDATDVGARYLAWWREGAFDTGPTAADVLTLAASGLPIEEAVAQVDERTGGMTAGCNPAHRSVPLAVCASIPDSELPEAAASEALLTHRHPLAGDVAAAVVRLCRALIQDASWSVALGVAGEGRNEETRRSLGGSTLTDLSPSGYAPDVLMAAVHFVGTSPSFPIALARSVDFAGPANYCPVLVGSIGGARWGRNRIEETSLHHHPEILARVQAASNALAVGWKSGV